MPHRQTMSPEEREAYLAELRARHEAGTLVDALQPDGEAVERLLSAVKRPRKGPSGPPEVRRSRR